MIEKSMAEKQRILHSPFDVYVHEETFVYYLEAIMWPDGRIEYAVPSHDEKLISAYASAKSMPVEEVKERLWKLSNDFDNSTMMKELGVILLWYDSIYAATKLTHEQQCSLSMLVEHGCISDEALSDIRYV